MSPKKLTFQNSRQFLELMTRFYYPIIGLPLVVFIVAYLFVDKGEIPALIEGQAALVIKSLLTLVVGGFVYASIKVFRTNIDSARQEKNLRGKLTVFFGYARERIKYIGIASVVAVIGLLLTASIYFAAVYSFLLILLSYHNPNIHNIGHVLHLKKEEKEILLFNRDID